MIDASANDAAQPLTDAGVGGCDGGAHTYAYPTGIYTDSSETVAKDNSINDVNVIGGLVRAAWNQIEATRGTYSWRGLDAYVDTIECNANCYSGKSGGVCSNNLAANGRDGGGCIPKPWTLSILGGEYSPSWLYAPDGGAGSMVTVADSGTIPDFWAPNVQARLQDLAAALAGRYGSDPSLKLVYIPQMSVNGVEGAFPNVQDKTLLAAGFTVDEWVMAAEGAAQSFAAAFPTKSIGIELHYLLESSCAGLRIMNDIATNGGVFAGRCDLASAQIGVAAWWYRGAEDPNTSTFAEYQPDLLYGTAFGDTADMIGTPEPTSIDPSDTSGRTCTGQATQANGFQGFAAAGGRVYSQVVENSATTRQGCAGDASPCVNFPFGYAAIFPGALTIPINYIEVWNQDVGTYWESEFVTFNAATHGM